MKKRFTEEQIIRILEEENRKLKKLLAESLLDNYALKSLVQKYGNAR